MEDSHVTVSEFHTQLTNWQSPCVPVCVCLFMCRCPIVAKYCTNSLVGPRRGPEKLTVEQWEAMIRVHESTHKCGLAIHRDQSCVEPNNGSSHADRQTGGQTDWGSTAGKEHYTSWARAGMRHTTQLRRLSDHLHAERESPVSSTWVCASSNS